MSGNDLNVNNNINKPNVYKLNGDVYLNGKKWDRKPIHVDDSVAHDVVVLAQTVKTETVNSASHWLTRAGDAIKNAYAALTGVNKEAKEAKASGTIEQKKAVVAKQIGAVAVANMTDEQVDKALDNIIALSGKALASGDIRGFIAQKNSFDKLIAGLASKKDISQHIRQKVETATHVISSGTVKADKILSGRARDAKTGSELENVAQLTIDLHATDKSIIVSVVSLKLSAQAAVEVASMETSGRAVAQVILAEAKAKGITLASLPQIDSMANGPFSAVVAVPVPASSNVFVSAWREFKDLLQGMKDVVAGIWANRADQNEQDKRVQQANIDKKVLENKKADKAEDQQVFDTKVLINKLSNSLDPKDKALEAYLSDPTVPAKFKKDLISIINNTRV